VADYLPFVRIVKITAIIAGILTGICILFIAAWQIVSFMDQGIWPTLTISSVLGILKQNYGHTMQATRGIGGLHFDGIEDQLLELPVVAPLTIAGGLVLALYLPLQRIEKRYACG
jgi:hypothetical protein